MLKYNEFINESVTRPWIYEGNFIVRKHMINNGKLIKELIPDEIVGNFIGDGGELISLEGSPSVVSGYFNCESNDITSLKGGPSVVGGNYYCNNNKLTSLEYSPLEVGGDFLGFNNGTNFTNNLKIEENFIESGSYKTNYWLDLLTYMMKEKIDLEEVKGWPEGFLNDNIRKSSKSIGKFNL